MGSKTAVAETLAAPTICVASPCYAAAASGLAVFPSPLRPLAIIGERRTEVSIAEVIDIIGDFEGQHCIMVDDLIDTGGTLVKGAEALMQAGRSRFGPALLMRNLRSGD